MPEFTDKDYVTDTYISKDVCIRRLIHDYAKFGRIIVAYDFDDTVRPQYGGNCDYVVELLQVCSKIDDIYMICFTCRNESQYDEVTGCLDELGIRHDKINENADGIEIETSRKILYSIFLDDRAGLRAAYETLVGFLNWYFNREED